MKLTQDWVGYLDRSYEQVKKSLLQRLTVSNPEITDHTESNLLIIILSMFAGVAEMLNLYIDSIAKEAFLGTARRYSSLIKLTRLIDYTVKARASATADVLFSLVNAQGVSITHTADIIIPKGTQVISSISNIIFTTLEATTIPANTPSNYGMAGQFTEVLGDILGTTSSAPNQRFGVPNDYVHNSMKLTLAGQVWELYNSLGLMGPTTLGFILNIDEEGNAFIAFGDGLNGKIPLNNTTIFADYQTTLGVLGNLPPNSIDGLVSVLTLPANVLLKVSNVDYASGGTDFESIEDIRNRAPRSLRTLDRAVTYQDYIDICLQVPGVGAAEVSFCCGKFIDVYIMPSSIGVATQALINKVRDYLEIRKMITTQIDVKPAGLTKLFLTATIYGKPLSLSTTIYNQTVDALDKEFGFSTIKINRKISLSDIIAIIEAQPSVDFVEIASVKILPYPRPLENTSNILNLEVLVLPTNTIKRKYTLIYNASTSSFEVYKDTFFLLTLAINTSFNDGGNITFKINAGTYSDGDKWEFTAYPSYPEIFPVSTFEINDYSAPIIDVGPFIDNVTPRTIFSNLTIITQSSTVATLPPCN